MGVKYKAVEIAKWFVGNIDRDAGDSITPLKLQKLVYYAQAWSLALLSRPLFDEDFQAWAHGPVVESVYQEYRKCGWNAIPPSGEQVELDEETTSHVQSILDVYGDYSAKHLEAMTHCEKPWIEARGALAPEARSTNVIRKDRMADFYKSLFEKADNAS